MAGEGSGVGKGGPASDGRGGTSTSVLSFGAEHAAINSGSLPTVALSSGVGAVVNAFRDMNLVASISYTAAGGTCAVALSPDGITYTTLVTVTPGIISVQPVWVTVPAGWRVMLTTSNATIGTATYY